MQDEDNNTKTNSSRYEIQYLPQDANSIQKVIVPGHELHKTLTYLVKNNTIYSTTLIDDDVDEAERDYRNKVGEAIINTRRRISEKFIHGRNHYGNNNPMNINYLAEIEEEVFDILIYILMARHARSYKQAPQEEQPEPNEEETPAETEEEANN